MGNKSSARIKPLIVYQLLMSKFSGIDVSTPEVAEAGSKVTLSCTIRGVASVVPVQWYTSNNALISEDLVVTGVTVQETPDSVPYQTSTVSLTSDMTASDGSFVCKFTSGTFSDTETHILDVFSELYHLGSQILLCTIQNQSHS